jgi:murein DD-endopeptidase MepM/ murein hydrolase activator NlpD
MEMIRTFTRRSGFRLAGIVILLAVPALACSRDTAATEDIRLLFQTDTVTSLPASPTVKKSPQPTDTQSPIARPSPTTEPSNTFPDTPTLRPRATPLPVVYFVQAGDTLRTIAIRFGVLPSDIRSVDNEILPSDGLLTPSLQLIIPESLADTSDSAHLFPDSGIVYSPTFVHFDPIQYINDQNGFLASYRSTNGSNAIGPETLRQVAFNNSFSPKLLLALLEYKSGWVTDRNPSADTLNYPLGDKDPKQPGLSAQLVWATNLLSIGYYGWRDASLLNLTFADGGVLRLAPDLNAGTVAILYFFARTTADRSAWEQGVNDFLAVYSRMFGNPFDQSVEPLYSSELPLTAMELPFPQDQEWAFTGGPHGAWEHDGARAALDFAPTDSAHCAVSPSWVTASAPGLIVRSSGNVVVIDLDGDGYEETGWNILYLHIATKDQIPQGSHVETGDRIGHPSCQGGIATGTHVHIARKFNGEWMLAGGPVPFVLSGWVCHAGGAPYEGSMVRDGTTIVAHPWASSETLIWR